MPSLREYLVGHLFFPFTNYLFNRKNVMGSYKELCRTEWYPESALRDMQLVKLKRVVEYTSRWIPYYRRLYKKIGLELGDIRSLEDFRFIPPLSRTDVIEHHKEMIDFRMQPAIPFAERTMRGPGEPIPFARVRKHKLVRNTSSGSTGSPTVFYEDGSRTGLNWAYELRLKRWYSILPGEKEARMARLSTEYQPNSRSLRMRRALWNQMILPGTNLSEQDFEYSMDRIRRFQPASLWGYTSALTGLADHIRRTGRGPAPSSLRLVIAWAAPLHDHEKELLEEVFRCPATNIYSAREVGHVAAICPAGEFHVNQENLLVESEKAGNGQGDLEELLVTNLDISPMPFLRYRMGDVGRVEQSRCACGRTLQVLKGLLGRTGEIFIAKDGRIISPNFWCRVFMSNRHSGQILRFQVVYTKEKNLRLILVRGKEYSAETEEYIRGTVRENFSEGTRLEIRYVDEIKPQISGKYQMVVNEGT
ncbi:MAG: phenylacetate--CoA ligase family protein [Deltaproteobacteria bacterium]